MLPAGLGIVAVSERAIEIAKTKKTARCFFDFPEMLKANQAGGYPYTPALQHFYGLRESLDMLLEEGLDQVFARHRRAADAVRAAVAGWGLSLCSTSAPHHSDTVSAIYVPPGVDSNMLTDLALRKYGVSFGIGLGQMTGKAFRIGHLGSITDTMILGGLATLEMAMSELAYPVKLGSGTTAAQKVFVGRP